MKYLILLAVLISSCRTVRKTTDTQREQTIFSSDYEDDSTGQKTENTTNVKTVDIDDNNNIAVEFFNSDTSDHTINIQDNSIFVDKRTGDITIKGKIKNATINSKTKTLSVDSTTTQVIDTASKKQTGHVSIDTKKEQKKGTTDRKGFFQIVALPAVIGAMLLLFLWFYIKRRKNQATD